MQKKIPTELNGFAPIIVVIAVVILVGLVGGGWYYTKKQEAENKKQVCTQEAKLCSDGSAVGRTGPNCEFATCPSTGALNFRIAYQTMREVDSSNSWTISVRYPEIQGLPDVSIGERINGDIYKKVTQEVTKVKDVFRTPCETYSETKCFREFEVDIVATSSLRFGTLSIRATLVHGGTDLAHPYEEFYTTTYNLNDGHTITLQDLFKEDSRYLQVISSIAKREISKKYTNYDSSGLEPLMKNFKNFLITDSGLYIFFDEYQVISRVSGLADLLIPWADLRNILAPDKI